VGDRYAIYGRPRASVNGNGHTCANIAAPTSDCNVTRLSELELVDRVHVRIVPISHALFDAPIALMHECNAGSLSGETILFERAKLVF
jgi:hypothetical protein